jgi:hypothetical protein
MAVVICAVHKIGGGTNADAEKSPPFLLSDADRAQAALAQRELQQSAEGMNGIAAGLGSEPQHEYLAGWMAMRMLDERRVSLTGSNWSII